jgi:hypothetical protein
VRIEGLEHNELNFQLMIKKDNKIVAQYQRNKANDISSSILGSLFTVLDQGKYQFVMTFLAKDSNIIKQPCQSIRLQIAMNKVDSDYLYPREQTDHLMNDELDLTNFVGNPSAAYAIQV